MIKTYLDVPFNEKDDAKALGACWDVQARKWYIPEGFELVSFSKWLPRELLVEQPQSPAVSSEQASSSSVTSIQGVPLSQLLSNVQRIVATTFQQGVWTLVEVMQAQAKNGHVYLELSERNAAGNTLATARGIIWANNANRILPDFQRTTGVTVASGIKLLVRARPTMHTKFGFSLEIDAINSDYTLGDLEAKKREIRIRLQQEGVFNTNRQLSAAWDFNHVLVIAPENAAGLGDFQAEAARLQHLGLCSFYYEHSLFQGEHASSQICAALEQGLNLSHEYGVKLDAVVLIRGGGAVNDLAWLNDYELARTICLMDIPVFTGIGHERDSTVLDEVAHTSFDTPSKVIGGIEQLIFQRAQETRDYFKQIEMFTTSIIDKQRRTIEAGMAQVQNGSLRAVHTARELSRNKVDAIRSQSQRQLNIARNQIPTLMTHVSTASVNLIKETRSQADSRLEMIVERSQRNLLLSREVIQQRFLTIRHETDRQLFYARNETASSMEQVHLGGEALLRGARKSVMNEFDGVLQRSEQAIHRSQHDLQQQMQIVRYEAQRSLKNAKTSADAMLREITGQGPKKTLARGFAVVRNAQGVPVTSPAATNVGEMLEIEFKDGFLEAEVSCIKGEKQL